MSPLDFIALTCAGRWQGTGDIYALMRRAATNVPPDALTCAIAAKHLDEVHP